MKEESILTNRIGGSSSTNRLVVLLNLVVTIVLGCNKPSSPAEIPPPDTGMPTEETVIPDEYEQSLVINGVERTYILHIPPSYDASKPVPLVLVFHGITLDANEMIRISGFNDQSDAVGFVVAYPNASGAQRSWNGGHCCGESAANNVDDVGFVRALIGQLTTLVNIDTKRVYATGFSNGAIMVYRLACELSNQIAAIGPVSATQAEEDLPGCQPERSIPVIHFHGTDDDPNPYNGGETAGGAHFIPVIEAIHFWAERNGCPTQSQQTESGNIFHDFYSPCKSGATVELYTVEGGKHAWPGGEAVSLRMGEPTMEISATILIWEFFLAHPMP